MPNSVPFSYAQTRCRNPASVCSSTAGSAPMSAWYQGPLTPRSRTVSATWLSAGKAIVDSSLFTPQGVPDRSPGGARFTRDHRPWSGRTRKPFDIGTNGSPIDGASAAGSDDSPAAARPGPHVAQIHLVAEDPDLAWNHPVGEPQRRQQPFELALLTGRPRQPHLRAELRRQESRGREQVEPTDQQSQRGGQECHRGHSTQMLAHRRVDPKVVERPFPELVECGAIGWPHVVVDLQRGAKLPGVLVHRVGGVIVEWPVQELVLVDGVAIKGGGPPRWSRGVRWR